MTEKNYVLFILLLVLLWLNTETAQLVAGAGGAANMCIDKERRALLDFKAHLEDPEDRLSTWRPEEENDCCKWSGVTCNNETGHVRKLKLHNRYASSGLRGEISLSLLNLTYLTHLHLSDNSFHGAIPNFIANMTQLTFLNLGGNELVGTIPKSIGSLIKLRYLELSGNNLSGTIPRSISSLTKLKYLYLSHNSFYGTIPPEFGNLTNLRELRLRFLGSCTVENLDWLSPLSNLYHLELDGSSFAKANYWVDVVVGHQSLVYLSLNGCNLSQVMHPYSSSVNSSTIVKLYLDNNNLNSSAYRWLCPLTSNANGVYELSLSGNTFDGKLSEFLDILPMPGGFQYLDVSNNGLKGSIPITVQNFTSLFTLNLSSNQLDGTISDRVWELPFIQTLDFSNNSLKGVPLYTGVLNFSYCRYIDVSSNKLGPHFPKWINKLSEVFHLDISNNGISDTIPTEYWNQWSLSELRYLNLSLNNISATLPDFLPNLTVYSLDLSSNNFYGPIPVLPAGIIFLNLSRNKFKGNISFLCQMYEQFKFLDLSHNSLTGQLSDCLRNLGQITVLNLGHNFLSGRLPPSLGYLGQLEMLCLYNNSFSGELPLSLRNCTKLSLLDLGANKLTGNVPVWIGESLSRLYVLSLRSNNFFGTIPLQLCELVSLQILDLSINNLHGTIPSCVNNFTAMVQKSFGKQNLHHYQWSFDWLSRANSYSETIDDSYSDHLLIEWQGRINEFGSTLGLVKTIDLSSNNLTEQIPNEVTNLHELLVLDLSNNYLVGEIPRDIGQMTQLLTLNLSVNMFSGEIPSTMSRMTSLNDLDLSYNDLWGRIPSGTQLQTFDPSRYTGNVGLCGSPLPKKCPGDEGLEEPHTVGTSEGDEEGIDRWFYIGGATGFGTGFWIVCSLLLVNRRGRHAFFHFHDSLKDRVCAKVEVFIAKWRRVVCA